MDPVEPPQGKEKDHLNNAASTGREQKCTESHGGVLSPSTTPSLSLGQPRSRLPQQQMISSQDGTLCPSGHSGSCNSSMGGPAVKGLLGPHPYSTQQSIATILPPKKRISNSQQLCQHSQNESSNSSMPSGKTPQVQSKRALTPPPPSPAKKGSISRSMITQSANPPCEDSSVDVGMSPHNNSGKSLKKTQIHSNMGPNQALLSSPPNMGLRFQVNTSVVQPHHKDSNDDVSKIHNNSSRGLVKMTQFQPNKTLAKASLLLPQNTGSRSHPTDKTPAQALLKGSINSVTVKANDNDNCSSQLLKIPKLHPKSPRPSTFSPPNTGLRSNVMIVPSVQPRLECSNVDVSMRQSSGQNDIFKDLRHWKSERKRLHSTNPFANVEDVNCTTTKKTRLNWGEGLAKYEKEKEKKHLKGPPVTEVNGELRTSNTKTTGSVAGQDTVPSLSCGSSPSHGGISTSGDLGSSSISSGTKGDFDNNSSSKTKLMVCPAASGARGDPDSNNSSMTEKVVFQAASISNMPQGNYDDMGNSNTEKMVFSVANGCKPPRVGASGHLDNSSTDMAHVIGCHGAIPSSHICNALKGVDDDIASNSTSTTEVMMCPNGVPSITPRCSPPQGDSFATSTTVQGVPHKLTAQGSDKIENSCAPGQEIMLSAEIIAPPHQGTSSAITTSDQDFRLTFPKIEGPNLRNLIGNRTSNDKANKEGKFFPSAMVQDIPDQLISQEIDKIESISAARPSILLASEIAPPYHGSSSTIAATNVDFRLTIPKLVEPNLRNLSDNKSSNVEVKEYEHKWKSEVNDISACKDSTNYGIQSGSVLLDGDESHIAINADCSHGERNKDGKHKGSAKENHEYYAASNDSNYVIMQSNKENTKSDKKYVIVNNGSELHGNESVQQQDDTGAMALGTNNNDISIKRDKGNPQNYVDQGEISGTVFNSTIDSMEVENNDTILIQAENEIKRPQQLVSHEAPRIHKLSSTSGPSAQTVNAKSSHVKFAVDLNIPLDVASVDLYSSHGRASIAVSAPRQTSQIDLNIPDLASMDDASDDRGSANSNLGASVEMAHEFTHVQNYLHHQTNQPGHLKLFGKFIFQAPCLPDTSQPQAPGRVTSSITNGEGSSTSKT